jgi:hypothetical protein
MYFVLSDDHGLQNNHFLKRSASVDSVKKKKKKFTWSRGGIFSIYVTSCFERTDENGDTCTITRGIKYAPCIIVA